MGPLIKVALIVVVPVVAAVAPRVVAAEQGAAATSPEINELKQGQEALRRDIEEIKKTPTAVTNLPPRPPIVEKMGTVVAVGDITPKGKKNAPLTLIEFTDYQCPFCARHATLTLPALVKDYVDTGKVRYVLRDFPLDIHPNAHKAAEAARCAGDQNKYWEMHDKLFAGQNQLQAAKLSEYAKTIGLNGTEFDACLSKGKYAKAVGEDLQQGVALGVRGTPTLVVGISDGDKVKDAVMIRGAHPLPTFTAEIDKMLAAPAAQKTE